MISCRQAVDEARPTYPKRRRLSQEVVPPVRPDLFGGAGWGMALLFWRVVQIMMEDRGKIIWIIVRAPRLDLRSWRGRTGHLRLVQGLMQDAQ